MHDVVNVLKIHIFSDFWLFLSEQIKQKKIPTPNLNIYYYHSDTFDLELAENAIRLAPR